MHHTTQSLQRVLLRDWIGTPYTLLSRDSMGALFSCIV